MAQNPASPFAAGGMFSPRPAAPQNPSASPLPPARPAYGGQPVPPVQMGQAPLADRLTQMGGPAPVDRPAPAMPQMYPPQASPDIVRPPTAAPPYQRGRAWNPSQGTPPPMMNPMRPAPGGAPPPYQMGRGFPGGPPISARPSPFSAQWRPPVKPAVRAQRPLNWQQQQMRMMPQQMRQAYNRQPMTAPIPNMGAPASPTMRGQPVASRVNLQTNQFGKPRF